MSRTKDLLDDAIYRENEPQTASAVNCINGALDIVRNLSGLLTARTRAYNELSALFSDLLFECGRKVMSPEDISIYRTKYIDIMTDNMTSIEEAVSAIKSNQYIG